MHYQLMVAEMVALELRLLLAVQLPLTPVVVVDQYILALQTELVAFLLSN
jgi:hypothetical protein